ncbi:MAG: SOS response-associated peptidase, partial [Verrucomicrobiota bacterium]
KDETIGDKLTNARADTITEKPSYRRPFEKQRCLIPADGFYEWQTTPTGKQPFRFTRKDGGFFCMAGLWERWHRPVAVTSDAADDLFPPTASSHLPTASSSVLETFTIITTEPNPMVAAVHNRMPVILGPEHYRWWLEPNRFEPQFLKTLLRPYPAEDMACYRVSKLVNNARFDDPACLNHG